MSAFRFAAAGALPFLIASAAQGSVSPVAAPVQTIVLRSYAYAPATIHLAAGKAVTLHFVNRAGKGHDFTARRFFRSARILAGSAPGGEVDVGPGRQRSVTLIPAAGTYRVHCDRMFHKQMGMRGTIVVH